MIWMPIAMALLGLTYMLIKKSWVMKQDAGDGKMKEISDHIYEGALAFLNAEYRLLTIFVVGASIVLAGIAFYMDSTYLIVVAFIIGAIFSAFAGNMGMKIATKTNVRTTQAAKTSLPDALRVSFGGGTVMGLGVAGLAVLGLTMFFIIFYQIFMGSEWTNTDQMTIVLEALAGFSLGAESIALFARVGGGIYTKAADVGADLAGKVQADIPEDDPRNHATIADNVGDNVGDVAGMGADLFESYVGSLVAPLAYAAIVFSNQSVLPSLLLFPLAVGTIGMGASILSSFLVVPKEGKLAQALHRGTYSAAVLTVIGVYFLSDYMFADYAPNPIGLFFSVIIGLAVGLLVGQISEWFTSDHYSIVKNIAEQAKTGPATLVLSGISEGMRSAAYSVIVVVFGIYGAHSAGAWALGEGGGVYGIAIAAIGVLSTLGITVAVDAYGPIADNAGGIAEMAHLPPEVREATDELDSLGNTTAAIAKGFAIASAAVTALALFSAFVQSAEIEKLDITEVEVTIGLFLGGMFPFLFAAMTISAVGRAAFKMIEEVRRQFNEIPGLREGKEGVVPDYTKCVDIATTAALREMLLPGGLAIALPLIIGFWNKEALGGFLAGSLVTGFLLAIFMANSGGAWDNAKKYIEAGGGAGKGSDEHKAAVIGDTIGDPFKDTSGPAMNIVIKVMTIVSLIFASAF